MTPADLALRRELEASSFINVPAGLIYSLLVPLCMLKASKIVELRRNRSVEEGCQEQDEDTVRVSLTIPGALTYAVNILPSTTVTVGKTAQLSIESMAPLTGSAQDSLESSEGPQKLSELRFRHSFSCSAGSREPTSPIEPSAQRAQMFQLKWERKKGGSCGRSSSVMTEAEDANSQEPPPSVAALAPLQHHTPAEIFSFPGVTEPYSAQQGTGRGDPSPELDLGLHTHNARPPATLDLSLLDQNADEEDEDHATARVFAGIRTGVTPPPAMFYEWQRAIQAIARILVSLWFHWVYAIV